MVWNDFGTLNSATKYPSIETYHGLDPVDGTLTDVVTRYTGPVVLTEKVDGTNARIVVMPDGDWYIGSREELLYARGDRIENPAFGKGRQNRETPDVPPHRGHHHPR